MPACSKTKTRPRGGVAAGQRRARGPSATMLVMAVVDGVLATRFRSFFRERARGNGSARRHRGPRGTSRPPRAAFPRAAVVVQASVRRARASVARAPSRRSRGTGRKGGRLEQLKDVVPQIQPPRVDHVQADVRRRRRRRRRRWLPNERLGRTFAKRRVFLRSSKTCVIARRGTLERRPPFFFFFRASSVRDPDPFGSTRHSFRPLPRRRRLADHLHAGEARGVVAQEDGGGAE